MTPPASNPSPSNLPSSSPPRPSAAIGMPVAAPVHVRHRDHSLAVILFMMALVFAPAAGLHLAALVLEPADAVAAAPSQSGSQGGPG
jgi:hypothetical protein